MTKRVSKETREKFIDKFSSYEGMVTKFFQENNISNRPFYYHKKALKKKMSQHLMLYLLMKKMLLKLKEILLKL